MLTGVRLSLLAQMVLLVADDLSNGDIAQRVGIGRI